MSDVFSTLPPHLAARARALVSKREEQGLNVHFINSRGEKDRFSFQTEERRDKFVDKLKRDGLVVL